MSSEGELKKRIREYDIIPVDSVETILDEAKAEIMPKFAWVEEEPGGYVKMFKKDLLEHFANIEKWFGDSK
jgi:hypothetical protein